MSANLLAQTSFGDLTGLGFDGQSAASDGLLTMLSVPVEAAPVFWESGHGEDWQIRRPVDDDEVLLIIKAVWGLLQ